MRTPGIPGAGITGATLIKLGRAIEAFITPAGGPVQNSETPPQRSIVVGEFVERRAGSLRGFCQSRIA